ncbi:MAG: hypothetical protein ACE14Q_09500 [Acidobacteriota bacterium]
MKCEDFDKFLFENPKAKICPQEFVEHLKECENCASLWKIQETLADIGEDKITFSLSPAQRANLILRAKKEFFLKTASSLIEDSFVVSLLLSLFILGIIASATNLSKFQLFEKVMPYIKLFSSQAVPFLKDIQAVFSSQAGSILGTMAVFFIVFAFTLFVKTLNPKRLRPYF